MNRLNCQCCLASSSKMSPIILISSIAMSANYSFEVTSIVHWVPQFIGHDKIVLGSVNCLVIFRPNSKVPILQTPLMIAILKLKHIQTTDFRWLTWIKSNNESWEKTLGPSIHCITIFFPSFDHFFPYLHTTFYTYELSIFPELPWSTKYHIWMAQRYWCLLKR